MLKLKDLTIKNFLSVGNVTQAMRLDDAGLTLILGHNTDSNGGTTRNGAGKAQPVSAAIKVPGGWSTMGDMRVGSLISTPDGGTAKVSGVFPQGNIPVYRIQFKDGRSTEACADHLWKVWIKTKGSWAWSVVNTKELAARTEDGRAHKRAYVPLAVPSCDDPDVNLPIDPKLLGILLGDGHLGSHQTYIATADEEVASYVEKNIPDGYHLVKRGDISYYIVGAPSGNVQRHELRVALSAMSLNGCKAETKFIPTCYKNASLGQRLALIQGLMDTDGTVGLRGEMSFSTASKILADDLSYLVRSVGGIARITTHQSRLNGVAKKLSYRVNIRHPDAASLVSLTRKKDRIPTNYQYKKLRLEVTTVTSIGTKESQCISVDHSDHLYITDDHIVTHNTTVIQAISYVVYGKPISKIKIPNLVNNINQKGMLVTLDFERDGVEYRIERGKKPDVMRLLVNGRETQTDEALGENRHTQTEIERLFGLSHTMFQHVVALNTMTEPFLRLRSGDQKEVIEELLGITQISARADVLKKLILATKENIRDQQSVIKATAEANERIENAIRAAETRSLSWSIAHEQRVADLAADLATTRAIDFDAELAMFDALDAFVNGKRSLDSNLDAAQREASLLERELTAIVTAASLLRSEAEKGVDGQVARLEADRARKTQAKQRHVDACAKKQTELELVLSDMTNADGSSCVCCGQHLAGTDHLKTVVENLAARQAEILAAITHEENEVTDLDNEIEDVTAEIEQVRASNADRASQLLADAQIKDAEGQGLRSRMDGHLDTVRKARAALEALGHKPQTMFDSRDEVYKTRQVRDNLERDLANESSQTNPHANEITNLTGALQPIDYAPVNEYTELLKHQDFLLKLLSNKDSFIRKKIIDQNLSYLNSRLNFYLDKLGLPHEVQFQSDLTVDITNLGRDFDFEQLSRGEMNRVIMATSWSFRDMWESTNVGCNLLWVDELLDQGTDTQGVEAALSILKSMARDRGKNVFLISHRDELQARIDRTLLVRKENGFTQLEIDGVG